MQLYPAPTPIVQNRATLIGVSVYGYDSFNRVVVGESRAKQPSTKKKITPNVTFISNKTSPNVPISAKTKLALTFVSLFIK